MIFAISLAFLFLLSNAGSEHCVITKICDDCRCTSDEGVKKPGSLDSCAELLADGQSYFSYTEWGTRCEVASSCDENDRKLNAKNKWGIYQRTCSDGTSGSEIGLSGKKDAELHFKIDNVPAGSSLEIKIEGGSGDADLYVKKGSAPTKSDYDYRPLLQGNSETCNVERTSMSATWYIMIVGYSDFSGVDLEWKYEAIEMEDENWVYGDDCGGLADEDCSLVECNRCQYSWGPNSFPGGSDSRCRCSEIASTKPKSGSMTTEELSGTPGAELRYSVDVPANSRLVVSIGGGNGDVDLYVKQGTEPTTSSYDCRPYENGNSESCSFSISERSTYHIMIRGYNAFSGVVLTWTYEPVDQSSSMTTETIGDLSAASGEQLRFEVDVPANSKLEVSIDGGNGDADLYVMQGTMPTTSSFDCRPYQNGNSESCSFNRISEESTWHIMIRGHNTAFSGVVLTMSYEPADQN